MGDKMKTIDINTSNKYNVIIDTNCLSKIGELALPLCKTKKAMIVTDNIVDKLYSKTVETSLSNSGFEVYKYVIPNGENSKNADNFLKILNALANENFTRTDTLFALGGGVVGDLTGFCASVYLRGISFIQIPTTLLAAVDSSVGGKTAINLDAGKNLAGAFYQPKLVLFDIKTLSTLSENIVSDGMAEVIKYGMIYDKSLFDSLKNNDINEDIIARCVEIKKEVVSEDEFENGLRKILNFGHTIGHAVEKCSNYTLGHGTCVAIGMALITKFCVKSGTCTQNDYDELCKVLKLYNLPVQHNYSIEDIYQVVKSDKKCSGELLSLILINGIGKAFIKNFPFSEIKGIVSDGN